MKLPNAVVASTVATCGQGNGLSLVYRQISALSTLSQATKVPTASSTLALDVRVTSQSTAQLFSSVGGWCRRTRKPSAGNLSRMHHLFARFPNSFSSNDVDDFGRVLVRSNLALHVRSRNLTDARDKTERCDQARSVLWTLFSL